QTEHHRAGAYHSPAEFWPEKESFLKWKRDTGTERQSLKFVCIRYVDKLWRITRPAARHGSFKVRSLDSKCPSQLKERTDTRPMRLNQPSEADHVQVTTASIPVDVLVVNLDFRPAQLSASRDPKNRDVLAAYIFAIHMTEPRWTADFNALRCSGIRQL